MGNILLHYHFLRQIAEKTGIEYFHPRFPYAHYFEGMDQKRRPFLDHFKGTVEMSLSDVVAFDQKDFLVYVIEQNDQGKSVVFSSPMLGDVFFDYLFFDPNQFIKVKKEYRLEFDFDPENKIVIGLHFRGTDFPAWNLNAVLEFEYYESALNHCLGHFNNKEIVIAVFTDDHQFPTYIKTVDFLKSLSTPPLYYGDKDKDPIYDFFQMTQCDVLISSPSTYAIFAGILGKKKKIIHNKKWLDYTINRNDTFWVKLIETDNPYYSLWRSF